MATKARVSDSGSVGLNINKIQAMQKALDTYVKEVNDKIKIDASTKEIRAAIKGSTAEVEVKNYIDEIDKQCEKYFNDLKKYVDKFAEMAETYKANDKFTR